jgi:hypothetical protein
MRTLIPQKTNQTNELFPLAQQLYSHGEALDIQLQSLNCFHASFFDFEQAQGYGIQGPAVPSACRR